MAHRAKPIPASSGLFAKFNFLAHPNHPRACRRPDSRDITPTGRREKTAPSASAPTATCAHHLFTNPLPQTLKGFPPPPLAHITLHTYAVATRWFARKMHVSPSDPHKNEVVGR